MALESHQWLDMDPLTFDKIIEIQLEDIENLSSRAKGKQREGTVTDAQHALQLYVDGLATSTARMSDRKVAEDVAMALLRDIPAMEEAARKRLQTAQGRKAAATPSGNGSKQSGRSSLMRKLQRNDSDPLRELWPALLDSDSDDSAVVESSSWAASQLGLKRAQLARCVACTECKPAEDIVVVSCKYKHTYCRDCLSQMFRLAMEDESLFPPKCDGEEIVVDMFRNFLPHGLVVEFESKYVELRTQDRTYCYDDSCSAFILPSSIDALSAFCTQCYKTTCIACKCSSHPGDCSGDEALRQLKETAHMQRWQRCYMCNFIVQLERGCNHITCRCGNEFCYICGSKWKTCGCAYWDEGRLFNQTVSQSSQIAQQSSILDAPPHMSSNSGYRNQAKLNTSDMTAPRPTRASRLSLHQRVRHQANIPSHQSSTRPHCAIQ